MIDHGEETVQVTKYAHRIYCDKCNKLLDETLNDIKDFTQNRYERKIIMHVPLYDDSRDCKWYEMKKDLCEDCFNKISAEILEVLKPFGFVSSE